MAVSTVPLTLGLPLAPPVELGTLPVTEGLPDAIGLTDPPADPEAGALADPVWLLSSEAVPSSVALGETDALDVTVTGLSVCRGLPLAPPVPLTVWPDHVGEPLVVSVAVELLLATEEVGSTDPLAAALALIAPLLLTTPVELLVPQNELLPVPVEQVERLGVFDPNEPVMVPEPVWDFEDVVEDVILWVEVADAQADSDGLLDVLRVSPLTEARADPLTVRLALPEPETDAVSESLKVSVTTGVLDTVEVIDRPE